MIDNKTYKEKLLTRLNELEERLQNIEHDLDMPRDADVEERATEREDDEVLETMGNNGLVEIEAISAALHRIENNAYGKCIECGNAISTARLDILPTAVKCRNCM